MDRRLFNDTLSIAARNIEWYGWMAAFAEQKGAKEKAIVVYFDT
jgi:hypothetical protein